MSTFFVREQFMHNFNLNHLEDRKRNYILVSLIFLFLIDDLKKQNFLLLKSCLEVFHLSVTKKKTRKFVCACLNNLSVCVFLILSKGEEEVLHGLEW